MIDHMNASLEELADAILEDGIIDSTEVGKIRERIFDDGVIDRDEADFLFSLNDGVSGKANDPGWGDLFVEAISSHVLSDEISPGEIDDDEAAYLIEKIEGDGQVDKVELKLLVNITSRATGECPAAFTDFVLKAVKEAVVSDGVVDESDVDMLKAVIYGTGGAGGSDVDRTEADMLFDINDATTGNVGHASSWRELFVQAISKHVLEDEVSPNEIDDDEADWLIARIEGDGKLDDNEEALLMQIKKQASVLSERLRSFLV